MNKKEKQLLNLILTSINQSQRVGNSHNIMLYCLMLLSFAKCLKIVLASNFIDWISNVFQNKRAKNILVVLYILMSIPYCENNFSKNHSLSLYLFVPSTKKSPSLVKPFMFTLNLQKQNFVFSYRQFCFLHPVY